MSLPLHIVQIVLDGMPWLPLHIQEFEKLSCDWTYHIAHGASANVGSTRWCQPQAPRLSRDGSSEFINGLLKHPNVKIHQRQLWKGGKDEMFRTALAKIDEPCVLFMPDVDEIFTAAQIEKIVSIFNGKPEIMRAHFRCRYFLGRNIVSTSENGYGNRRGEFLRAFRWNPDMTFDAHEPVIISGNRGQYMSREETQAMGIVFDHFAWALESQVLAKQKFYGYAGAVDNWKRLQENRSWPVKNLKEFLPWVGDGASADLFSNVYPKELNPMDKFKA